jgi:hypothetical protein
MSIVPQECVLFDDSVYNNIAFSNPNAYVNIQALNWISNILMDIKSLYNNKLVDFLELYCGCGNHTVVIAPYVNKLLAVIFPDVKLDFYKDGQNVILPSLKSLKITTIDIIDKNTLKVVGQTVLEVIYQE